MSEKRKSIWDLAIKSEPECIYGAWIFGPVDFVKFREYFWIFYRTLFDYFYTIYLPVPNNATPYSKSVGTFY